MGNITAIPATGGIGEQWFDRAFGPVVSKLTSGLIPPEDRGYVFAELAVSNLLDDLNGSQKHAESIFEVKEHNRSGRMVLKNRLNEAIVCHYDPRLKDYTQRISIAALNPGRAECLSDVVGYSYLNMGFLVNPVLAR